MFGRFVNALLTGLPEKPVLSYADDSALIAIEETWPEVGTKTNEYLEYVLIQSTLNIQKTVYITIGNHRDSVPKKVD